MTIRHPRNTIPAAVFGMWPDLRGLDIVGEQQRRGLDIVGEQRWRPQTIDMRSEQRTESTGYWYIGTDSPTGHMSISIGQVSMK